jgi:hypothetical protein
MDEVIARRLVDVHGYEHCSEKLSMLNGQAVNNPPGWLYRAIEEDWKA